jgi:REP element-mobilizing transposase RayT
MYTEKPRHRKQIRLVDYDYSQDGAYFATIVTQNHDCLFGSIMNDEMIFNDAGIMIDNVCDEIQEFIPGVELSTYQIMPNHFHAIIFINSELHIGPKIKIQDEENSNFEEISNFRIENPVISLPAVIQRFKSLTTRRYIEGVQENNWPRFDRRLWQRNYYEHVIRSERDYEAVAEYIMCNPKNWKKDEEFIMEKGGEN